MKISHSAPFLFFFHIVPRLSNTGCRRQRISTPLHDLFLFRVFYRRRGYLYHYSHRRIRTFFFLPGLFTMLLYHVGQVCSKYVMVVKYDRVSWALCGISLAVHRLLLETLQIVIRDE